MSKDFLSAMSSFLFLEADKEGDPVEVEDYSLDSDSLDNEDEQEEQTPTETEGEAEEEADETQEDPLESEESEDYSMDTDSFDSEEGETPEGENSETLEGTEDEEMSDEERYKKYILVGKYKEFISDINNLLNALSMLSQDLDKDLYTHYLYIDKKLNSLKEKCTFTIQCEFLTKPYTSLLTSYLYFRKELDAILDLIEKIKSNNE